MLRGRTKISDFVEWELDRYRTQCNFTDEELEFFNHRANDCSLEQTAELMNVSVGKTHKLSAKIRMKMAKVDNREEVKSRENW